MAVLMLILMAGVMGFDTFDNDSSQWNDTDNDGYGDQLNGFQGDACPKLAGNSTKDRFGCLDSRWRWLER